MRIILYAGKGGVGKTTTSAATGVAAAQRGDQTLVISVDPAHSLSDAFDTDIGPAERKITKTLYGQELDVQHEMEHNWGNVRNYVEDLFSFLELEDVKASEMAVFPGMEEAAALLNLYHRAQEEEYDTIIIDLAPTGNAMRLLTMPDVLDWYMRKIFPVERKVMKYARPFIKKAVSMPLPTDEVFSESKELYQKLEHVNDLLTDPSISTVRPVLNPERMVIKESRRLLTQLSIFDLPVDAAVVNRVLPADAGYPEPLIERQMEHLETIRNSFEPLPLFYADRIGAEMVGLDALQNLAENLWGDEDPSEVFHREKPIRVVEQDDAYVLELKLPFTSKEEVDLFDRGDELMIRIGQFRRTVFLPTLLKEHAPTGAKFEGDKLRIRFE